MAEVCLLLAVLAAVAETIIWATVGYPVIVTGTSFVLLSILWKG